MKKVLIVKETGQPVKVGDVLRMKHHHKTENIEVTSYSEVLLTEKKIRSFLKRGILVEQVFGEESKYANIPSNIEYYIMKYIDKIVEGFDFKTRVASLKIFARQMAHYPMSVTCCMLREIALELDNMYPDLIAKSPEIWVLDVTDGKIAKLNKRPATFRNFAAFRCKEDAEFAKKVLGPFYKACFSNGGKPKDKKCNCHQG